MTGDILQRDPRVGLLKVNSAEVDAADTRMMYLSRIVSRPVSSEASMYFESFLR